MARQKSQPTSAKVHRRTAGQGDAGTLFIVGTPIGSPDDLTIRARTILGQVSIVAAENPLVTQSLLAHHGIRATVTSYERGQEDKLAVLIDRLQSGHDVALVSDAGMPVIYDPGRLLVAAAQAAQCRVTVIPGPSAVTAAAALSGYAGDRILFIGRLPRARQHLDRLFTTLKGEAGTTILFAQRPELTRALQCMQRILPHRAMTVAVNMTRDDERLWYGCAASLLKDVRGLPANVEITLALSGAREKLQNNQARRMITR
jgi:16S rRNA (cytidine1402-2'-O)-methyltransferase